jgi:hypothetical protein
MIPRRIVLLAFAGLMIANALPAAEGIRLHLSLIWQVEDQADKDWRRHECGWFDAAALVAQGVWVAWEERDGQHFPCVFAAGQHFAAPTPVQKMTVLQLLVRFAEKEGDSASACLYARDRLFISRPPDPKNVTHLLVLTGFADETPPGAAPAPARPDAEQQTAFTRTRGLALRYAAASDQKTRDFAKLYGVTPTWTRPRLIVASEQWTEVKEEPTKKKASGNGLFGGALDDVADEIGGKKAEATTHRIPSYLLDVLRNDIDADSAYAFGFQAARSVWNDMLEGKVICEATGGRRRALTATVVFSQLAKNRATGKSKNEGLRITRETLRRLFTLPDLPTSAQVNIAAYLFKHPGASALIPREPVLFFDDKDQPSYALYAYFLVDPQTGRMTGCLPNDCRGGISEELARLEEGLKKRIKEKVGAQGAPVRLFFSQVAGMYVSTAGVIDAIGMTIADPTLAALDGEAWNKFVANHSLDFCQQFLEDNADMYDSYEALIGFWQGSIPMIAEFGGKEAARKAVDHALTGIRDKAIADAKSAVEEKTKDLRNAARKDARDLYDKALDRAGPHVRDAAKALEAVKDCHDKAVSIEETMTDYRDRAEAVWNDLQGQR